MSVQNFTPDVKPLQWPITHGAGLLNLQEARQGLIRLYGHWEGGGTVLYDLLGQGADATLGASVAWQLSLGMGIATRTSNDSAFNIVNPAFRITDSSFPYLANGASVVAAVEWRGNSTIGEDTNSSDLYQTLVGRGGVFENDTNFVFGFREKVSNGEKRIFLFSRSGTALSGQEIAFGDPGVGNIDLVGFSWADNDNQILGLNGNVLVSPSATTLGTDGGQPLTIGGPNTYTSNDRNFVGRILWTAIWERAIGAGLLSEITGHTDRFVLLRPNFPTIGKAAAVAPPTGGFFARRYYDEFLAGAA